MELYTVPSPPTDKSLIIPSAPTGKLVITGGKYKKKTKRNIKKKTKTQKSKIKT